MDFKRDESLMLGLLGAGIIFAAVAAIYLIAPETIHGFVVDEYKVTVEVDFAGFAENMAVNVYVQDEETAADALEAIADVEYSGGRVSSINGIENSQEYSWQYSDTTLSEGDVIMFEYAMVE